MSQALDLKLFPRKEDMALLSSSLLLLPNFPTQTCLEKPDASTLEMQFLMMIPRTHHPRISLATRSIYSGSREVGVPPEEASTDILCNMKGKCVLVGVMMTYHPPRPFADLIPCYAEGF